MIPQETINTILSSANIVEVINEYVSLKKKGINYAGCCPFHDEKTASFVVSPHKGTPPNGIYHCFGCGVGGNVIKFVQEYEKISYPEAIKKVAEKYNIIVTETGGKSEAETKEKQAEYAARESIKNVTKWASGYFSSNVKEEAAVNYFIKRELSDDVIDEFKLGYAIADWSGILNNATRNGFHQDILIKAGLIKKGDRNSFDYFRNRIIFPFFDVMGNVIGFTGRDISDVKETAKYLNSPDTDIFNKGSVLYGLYQAKRSIQDNDSVYLVEGNIDVLRFFRMNIKNTVAGSGTALTKAQCQLIKRFTNNVTIVYDGDKAGIKATFKNIDIILENGLNVTAVMLPEGEDPDSFGRKLRITNYELRDKSLNNEIDPNVKLKKWLDKNERDFIDLKFHLLNEDADNSSKKATISKEILHTISLISDDFTRNEYKKKCITQFNMEQSDVDNYFKQKKNLPDKPADSKNGWIGLETATDAIKEKEECLITLDYDTMIELICEGSENIIYHTGKIEELHLQELNKITQNIVLIDKITISDIENESKIIQLGKRLFKYRINVKIFEEYVGREGEMEARYFSFLDFYVMASSKYINKNKGDNLIRKNQYEGICDLLSHADNTIISVSTSYIAKQLELKETAFTKILQPYLEKRKTKVKMQTEGLVSEGEILQFDPERLPAYVDQEKFRRYGYFAAQNSKGVKVAYVFRNDQGGLMTVGNFYMEPLFHVKHSDPVKNKRIVQINNGEQNKQFFLELPSDAMVDFVLFKKMLIREGGNVFCNGKPIHFERIVNGTSNSFPTCFELTTFGQQHEGFFAFTNAIFSNGEMKFTDEYGLVEHNEINYYSPAFSKIYSGQRKDDDKYEQDRFFVYKENKSTDFTTWAKLMNDVYAANDNGKWAIVMALLSAFRSVIYPIDRLFTSLFFSGPTESGKTQIAVSIRSLFMLPEAPLFNLNSGTDAAFFATLERYRDIPIIFEEYNDYQISDIKFQGLKAAVYDGEGKTKRKDASSKDLDISKVNGVPLLLGQERPERDDGSLGNRCVQKQVPKKSDWTDEEKELFTNLKDREKAGLANILIEVLRIRPLILSHFAKQQRICFKDLKAVFRSKGITTENRITNTVSLFVAMVKVLETYAPHLELPFTYDEFFVLAQEQIIEQSEQILSTNRLSGFFEAVEILMLREKILPGRDFKIEISNKVTIMLNQKETIEKCFDGDVKILYLRINNIHSHYVDLKKNEALKMGNLNTYIKDHPAYIGYVKSTRYNWTEYKDFKDPTKNYVEKIAMKSSANTGGVAFNYDILKDNVNIDLEKYDALKELMEEEETGTSTTLSDQGGNNEGEQNKIEFNSNLNLNNTEVNLGEDIGDLPF